MKRLSFMLAILLSLVMISATAEAQSISKVLLIPREGRIVLRTLDFMLKKEVGVMTDMLQKAGFKVVVANISGQPMEGSIRKLTPDLKLSEVKVADYAGVIVACMAVGQFQAAPPVSPIAVSIVQQAIAKGKPVAAQLGALYILAEAGVLKGKRYALVDDPLSPVGHPIDSRFEGAIYSGAGVVQDGNIITSGVCAVMEGFTGMPDCTAELTRAFIAKLGGKE